MRRQLTTTAILILGFLTAYGQTKNTSKVVKTKWKDINNLTVFQYIDLLKIDKEKPKVRFLSIVGKQTVRDWITEKDVDSLIVLTNSPEPAKCVKSPLSSQIPKDSATIGGQVLYLLEAYKQGQDYPAFLASCGITDKRKMEELKQFWKGWKK